jgi:hypothetical protein
MNCLKRIPVKRILKDCRINVSEAAGQRNRSKAATLKNVGMERLNGIGEENIPKLGAIRKRAPAHIRD